MYTKHSVVVALEGLLRQQEAAAQRAREQYEDDTRQEHEALAHFREDDALVKLADALEAEDTVKLKKLLGHYQSRFPWSERGAIALQLRDRKLRDVALMTEELNSLIALIKGSDDESFSQNRLKELGILGMIRRSWS